MQFHEPIIGCHPPVNSLMWTWNNNPGRDLYLKLPLLASDQEVPTVISV